MHTTTKRSALALAALLSAAACNEDASQTPTQTSNSSSQIPDELLGGTGSDSIALIGGGTANKIWVMDGKFHRQITSIWGDGLDGRNLPRMTGAHQYNYPDLHDTHAVCTPKNFSRIYTANWFSYDEPGYAIEFDPVSLKQIRRVQVGKGGHHCALSPDDKYLYVANQYSTTVSVIDTATFTKVKDVDVGGEAVYPSPTMYWDGEVIDSPYIFVSVMGNAPVDNNTAGAAGGFMGVAVIDVKTNTLVKQIPIGTMVHGVNLTPDGKEVWVAQLNGESTKGGTPGIGDVTVIDVQSLQITRRIKVGAGGIHIVFDRTNKFAFATGGGNLWKIDRQTYAPVWGVATDAIGAHLGVTPDNKEIWTLNHAMNGTRYPYKIGGMAPTGVQIFSTDDGHLIGEIPTEAVSHEIQFVPRATFGTGAAAGATVDGSVVFSANCAVCHGPTGGGTMGGPALNTGKWMGNATGVETYIKTGNPANGMPAYGTKLSPAELTAVADFVSKMGM